MDLVVVLIRSVQDPGLRGRRRSPRSATLNSDACEPTPDQQGRVGRAVGIARNFIPCTHVTAYCASGR